MDIYVVRQNDSLWSIARKYGVSMDSISDVNKLWEIPGLVVGQALVIPTEAAPSANYGVVEVNAYIEPSTAEKDISIIDEVKNSLTYLSVFSYRITEDGSLIPLDDDAILSESLRNKIAPLMVITNFKGGTFDTQLGHTILSNDTLQQKLIDTIVTTMKTKGYYGLNIDFERIDPADRELYNNFLRKTVAVLRPLNYPVATALAPKTSSTQTGAWYTAHDYKAHGEIVDFVILMTYEWGWSGGPPLPVAPIDNVRQVLDYAVTEIPRNKIVMGMPLYGYDWTLPYTPQGEFAKRVSPQEALSLASRHGSFIRFDQKSKSPFFNYYDSNKSEHIVWFEDARSVRAKFLLVNELALRGVSYWVLGPSFPQIWYIQNNMFKLAKVIP